MPDTSGDFYSRCPASVLLNDGYDYDQNGNVAAISDGIGTHRGNRTMTYDGLDRLKTAVSPMYGNAAYAYDALDNLTRATIGGTAARDHWYCYDAHNQLTNVKTGGCAGASVIGLGYDVQGNLANKNGVAYSFDFGNRLRSVASAPASSYVYDGLGRRTRDYVGGSKYSFYSREGQLVYANDLRQTPAQSDVYYYLGSRLVAVQEIANGVGTVKYQHTDALGSPVAVTDANRVVIEKNEYEPFGLVNNHPPKDGPGYTGHVLDAATGLNYMQQRYYDPGIGRMLSMDPVTAYSSGDMRHFNGYAYANNNPYRFIDPDGRQSLPTSVRIGTDDPKIQEAFWGHQAELLVSLFTGTDAGYTAPSGSGETNSAFTAIESVGASTLARGVGGFAGAVRGGATASIATPHGAAVQSATAEAQTALSQVRNGAQVYRAGQFGVQNAAEGQYWSLQNPTTTAGYANQMGMPGAPRLDWVMSGRVPVGGPVITRPAPGIGANAGGAMEAVVPPGGVQIDWFHMFK